jgi:cytochrome c oxidase accessory protein FixG
MRVDQAPWSANKVAAKTAKHTIWLAIALWTGITFVGYFTPIKTLMMELASLSLGPWETFWILFYGFATYGNAGFMREQVCKYMCPYARFQSVMFDPDTLVISYDTKRGEPRGRSKIGPARKATGLGDCVDCGICVQVCPTGIDIRKGLQYECIGCGACIDGCNQVMEKVGLPHGLIRYSTENALHGKYPESELVKRVARPRVLIYTAALSLIIMVAGTALYLKVPLKVNVIRDRATLVRETPDGSIENLYRLQIMNTAEQPRRYVLSASGLPGLKLMSEQAIVEIPPVSSRVVPVRLVAPPEGLKPGSNSINFHVVASDDDGIRADEKSSFIARRK